VSTADQGRGRQALGRGPHTRDRRRQRNDRANRAEGPGVVTGQREHESALIDVQGVLRPVVGNLSFAVERLESVGLNAEVARDLKGRAADFLEDITELRQDQ
jgi:hypothetical protein